MELEGLSVWISDALYFFSSKNHDGHHRATRALLDGQMVRAVVFDFHDINAETAKRYEV